MEDKKEFLGQNQKKLFKLPKLKVLSKFKNFQKANGNKNILYIIIAVLILIITILLFIIFFTNSESDNYNDLLNPKLEDYIYMNSSEMDEPKDLFVYKGDSSEIKDKERIRICYCIDNNLVYPTLVSMTSALENNNNEKNVIVFYLFFPHNFDTNNIEIFESLRKKYLLKIYYFMIPPRFNNFRKWSYGTFTSYFKLFIPIVLPHIKRILYLDSDTLVYKDLYELFNLDFKDNYALGYPFHTVKMTDKWNSKIINYIHGGVLLLNLEKMIFDIKDVELMNFAFKNNNQLNYLDQDALNIVFYNKTGLLPLKYGIYLFGDITTYKKNIKPLLRIELDEKELIDALNEPSLIHFSGCYPNIWVNKFHNPFGDNSMCNKAHKDFYFYASKTEYDDVIRSKYLKT